MTDVVTYALDGHIATITLNRPERRNAINPELNRALVAAVERLDGSPAARIGILTGRGPVFCAGADLTTIVEGEGDRIGGATDTFAGMVSMTRRKPLIAAVNGHALAGGLELMLACDLVVAAEHAEFGLPEVTLGLVAVAGGVLRLPRQIGQKRALEVILTGRRFDARDALAWGLVNRVVPAAQVIAVALGLAEQIAGNAPLAVEESLRLARVLPGQDHRAAWDTARSAWNQIVATDDAREGVRAFADKRTPIWRGT